jgi:hypothetical protein
MSYANLHSNSLLLRATTAHALPGYDHLAGVMGRGFSWDSMERFAVNPAAARPGKSNLSLTSRYQTSFIAVV